MATSRAPGTCDRQALRTLHQVTRGRGCGGFIPLNAMPVVGIAGTLGSGMNPQGATVMEAVVRFLHRVMREESGQDMVEYALILGLVSIIAVIAVTATGTAVNDIWTAVQAAVEAAVP